MAVSIVEDSSNLASLLAKAEEDVRAERTRLAREFLTEFKRAKKAQRGEAI